MVATVAPNIQVAKSGTLLQSPTGHAIPILVKNVKMTWILKICENLCLVGQIAHILAFISSINLRIRVHTVGDTALQHLSVLIARRY